METTILVALVGIIGGIIGSACTMFLQHYLTIKKDKQTELNERKRHYATELVECIVRLNTTPTLKASSQMAGAIFMVEVYFGDGVIKAVNFLTESPPNTVDRDKALKLLKLELKKELVGV